LASRRTTAVRKVCSKARLMDQNTQYDRPQRD
jgi:hypothetical protein